MKKTLFACLALAGILAVTFAAMTLVSETASPTMAGPCRCPLLYAPVLCDNGRVYSNQCFATCAHAKNCVPTGGGVQ